ncbi:hypothetical protein [Cellulomonas sp. URHE0023]|uniref:hypothetical protein n=1 Tax=Cellulomonas sp. URHE0023 TaxID=1380354 RepID=UPI0004810C55|nr:hypothetical protein [Cellulomonas sp. URHE0023]
MDMTSDGPDLDTPLAAGQVRVVPRMDGETSRRKGAKYNALDDDYTMAEVDGPWGALRISMDGFPISFRAQIDGQMVATLTAVTATFNEEGPIATFKGRDVPVVLGTVDGGVRFVAQGNRLRPAGRKRFLRVTCEDRVWTYGATETHTDTDHALGKVLGSGNAATELRRGPEPATGHLVTSWVNNSAKDEKDPSGKNYIKLSWADGTTLAEIVLTLLLKLGTNDVKLTPLWWRAVDFGGAF